MLSINVMQLIMVFLSQKIQNKQRIVKIAKYSYNFGKNQCEKSWKIRNKIELNKLF